MITKYPLEPVLMEFSVALESSGDALQLNWRPREENQPADDLTNGNFEKFNPSLRIPVQITLERVNNYEFKVLPQLMQAADALHKEIQAAKIAQKQKPKAAVKSKGLRKAQLKAFKERHRW